MNRFLGLLIDGMKIPAHELERVPFFVDFPLGPHAESAEELDRWAPSLYGMLEEEGRDNGWQDIPASIHQASKGKPDERYGGSIGFERSLDVPLPI